MNEEEIHKEFVKSLNSGEILLVKIRDELYNGSFDGMLEDLKDRLCKKNLTRRTSRGNPSGIEVFEAEIVRVEQMQKYELKHGVNLTDYLG